MSGDKLIKSSVSPPVEIVTRWLLSDQTTVGVPNLCLRGGEGLEGMTLFSFESATEHAAFIILCACIEKG